MYWLVCFSRASRIEDSKCIGNSKWQKILIHEFDIDMSLDIGTFVSRYGHLKITELGKTSKALVVNSNGKSDGYIYAGDKREPLKGKSLSESKSFLDSLLAEGTETFVRNKDSSRIRHYTISCLADEREDDVFTTECHGEHIRQMDLALQEMENK